MTAAAHPETLMGWMGKGPVPPELREALAEAGPLPATLTDAWREFEAIHAERAKRAAVGDALPLAIQARYAVAVETLDTLPAPTLDSIRLRGLWLHYSLGPAITRPPEKLRLVLDTLLDDIETLQAATAQPLVRPDPAPPPIQRPAQADPKPAARRSSTQPAEALSKARKRLAAGKPPAPFEVRAQVLEILATEEGATLSNRAIARRLGCSPSSVASGLNVII